MRVRNKTNHDVHVHGYGNLSAEEEATVPQSDNVKQLIKADVLSEVKATSGGSSGSSNRNGGEGE